MSTTTAKFEQASSRGHFRLMAFAPPIAALCYPFFLKAFSASVANSPGQFSVYAAALLVLAVGVSAVGFLVALNLGGAQNPTFRELLSKRIALLSAAAAPIYTATGVLLYMAGDPIRDITFWAAFWGLVIALLAISMYTGSDKPITYDNAPVLPKLRVAHGASALAIIVLFLAMHFSSHLAALLSDGLQRDAMKLFRLVYRAEFVEPVIVLLFLFQVVSGAMLLWNYSKQKAGFFRTLQIVSGGYLIFFVLGHMNSVFFYARTFAGIETDWNFATGAPAGLINDAWNIRLVPHYLLGVFYVLAHLALGARIVAIARGAREQVADRYATIGVCISAVVAVSILLGMIGVRLAR